MQAQFFTDLKITSLGGRWWEMFAPLSYYSKIMDATMVAPTRFVFDGVSRPIMNRPTAASGMHDLPYRWRFMGRINADRVFNEAMRTEGRILPIRWVKTGFLFGIGFFFFKNMPGCLDPRFCRRASDDCEHCDKFYPRWQGCYRAGFHPELWREHE